MSATFTALHTGPAAFLGRGLVGKARAAPPSRAAFQISAASTSRPLWAPGMSSSRSRKASGVYLEHLSVSLLVQAPLRLNTSLRFRQLDCPPSLRTGLPYMPCHCLAQLGFLPHLSAARTEQAFTSSL